MKRLPQVGGRLFFWHFKGSNLDWKLESRLIPVLASKLAQENLCPPQLAPSEDTTQFPRLPFG